MQDTTDGASTDDSTGLRMFEFVRIRSVKSHEARLLKQSIGNEAHKNEPSSSPENLSNMSLNVHYGIPTKRSGHRAVCNTENLWIWGGFCPIRELDDEERNSETDRSPLFPELWRFNFSTRRWTLLDTSGDIPHKFVASHSTILFGSSTLIVFGGTGYPFGESLSNSLYLCNLNTLVWKKYELKGEKPLPLYGSSLLMVGDYLYILFGTNAVHYCSNVYRVNIKTLESVKLFDSIDLIENSSFSQLNKLNQLYPNGFLYGRYRQEVIHYDNKMYTFGGGKIDGDAHPFDNLPVFNIETNKWEFVSTLPDLNTNTYPEKRKFHSCLRVDHFAYMFGGMYCNLEDNWVFRSVDNCVWQLNMIDLRWRRLNMPMTCLTSFHAADRKSVV